MAITVSGVKDRYLPALAGKNDQDATLTLLLADVLARAIDYIDSDSYATSATFSSVLESAVMKQCAYEFARRRDLGLSSVTAPDGTASRFANDDWLPDVKQTLDRYAAYTLGQSEDA